MVLAWLRTGYEMSTLYGRDRPTKEINGLLLENRLVWIQTAPDISSVDISKTRASVYIIDSVDCAWKAVTQKIDELETDPSLSEYMSALRTQLAIPGDTMLRSSLEAEVSMRTPPFSVPSSSLR